MTRGKWVALAVGVAVMALLVPYGPAMWRVVTYEDRRIEDLSVSLSNAAAKVEYMIVSRKRFDWVSGPDSFVRCSFCVESEHRMCPRDTASAWVMKENPRSGTWEQRFVLCTCPHPSHAQDSK